MTDSEGRTPVKIKEETDDEPNLMSLEKLDRGTPEIWPEKASLDSYTIIQTFEHNESNLSALPSKWVNKKGWNGGTPDRMSVIAGNDLCYWPKGASGYRLLEQAKLDPTIAIDKRFLSAFRCKILKENIPTYVEAICEQKTLEKELNELNKQPLPTASASLQSDQGAEGNVLLSQILSSVESLQRQVQIIAKDQQTTKTQVNKCYHLLLQINDRLNEGPPQTPQALGVLEIPSSSNATDPTNTIPLKPVKSLEDMEALQDHARDPLFVQSVIRSMGMIHGKCRHMGEGRTICLRVVDYFFDRRFMLTCSWTGTARGTENNGARATKIPFQRFDKVINLFYQVVLYSDPTFLYDDCLTFLHRCVRNAKQRFAEVKGMRLSVARKRRRRMEKEPVVVIESIEADEDESNSCDIIKEEFDLEGL
ncbi:uncharacterized protein LOC6034793 [Culex quinquefasciatus]|uniref:uncharacterized protein LOC6034793 n=1 Tax=Culex quinquefasciatus TaxID=7176 RepID=UPI0018E39D2D|nr:uncharacterized protein LOC6034793 [Culex quinquefasciatus]